jgi:fluoroacetyl-CoA thioesterase
MRGHLSACIQAATGFDPGMTEPETDSTGTAHVTVEVPDLARAIAQQPDDLFPEVFATARMVALMEIASARVLHPVLGADQLSVGVAMDIVHTAATPLGVTVWATARYTGRDGKLFVFDVLAHDSGGEIGRGTHKRAIVDHQRLIDGAIRRTGKQTETTG